MASENRWGRAAFLAAAVFVLALALRMSNAPFAFGNGVPILAPLDELYHWKRITFSAAHFPQVLEFDPQRGVAGAFCPWPPLYDLLAGGTARLLGASDPLDVLTRAVWFPPLLGALFAALATALIARAFGAPAAIACGIALAASPFVVTQSSIGSIDHHFLEWPLTFAILGATCRKSGVLLGLAIVAAMFVQTALLIPAALAFVVIFFFTDGKAGTIAFAIAAGTIALYRLTRLPGYPDNQWFLGWTHVALFAGAAVACALRKNRLLALAAGAAVASTTLPSVLSGIQFFGGETWLHTIAEFQPLWRAKPEDLLSYGVGLGAGAILVWPLALRAIRGRDLVAGTIALFAIVHLLLTITSRRFTSPAIPLLALAGGVFGGQSCGWRFLLHRGEKTANRSFDPILLLFVAVPPVVQFALWMRHPEPAIPSGTVPWVRAARFLATQQPTGRVLAPWSMGHVLDVLGEHPVIIDNFGTMPNEIVFERAHDAFLSRDEERLARYCRESGVRWIVIGNPPGGLTTAAAAVGVDPDAYVHITGGTPPFRVSHLAQSTWWWRAYYGRRSGRFGLVYADPQPYAEGTPFRGPSIEIWEFHDDFR